MSAADFLVAVGKAVERAHNQVCRRDLTVVYMAGNLNIDRQRGVCLDFGRAVVHQQNRLVGIVVFQQLRDRRTFVIQVIVAADEQESIVLQHLVAEYGNARRFKVMADARAVAEHIVIAQSRVNAQRRFQTTQMRLHILFAVGIDVVVHQIARQ